ncbi:MAG: hypothetical protein ABIZ81_10700 [Opitutaceae bacterium]
MKRILSAFFTALFFVTVASAIQVGDAQAEVVRTLGEPVATRMKPSGSQVWKMKDGTTVWLARGLVSEIAVPRQGSSIERGGVAIPVVATTAEATQATSETTESAAAVANVGVDHQPKIGHFLLLIGLGVVAISKFQFCQLVFKTRGWQFLGCFVPFISFAFVFSHWKQTKKLFAWQMLVALPLLLIGFHLAPVSPATERAGLSQAAFSHAPVQPRATSR